MAKSGAQSDPDELEPGVFEPPSRPRGPAASKVFVLVLLALMTVGQGGHALMGLMNIAPISPWVLLAMAGLGLAYAMRKIISHFRDRSRPLLSGGLIAGILLMTCAAPIASPYTSHLYGYWLRVKMLGHTPQLADWSANFRLPRTAPGVDRDFYPADMNAMPEAARRLGWRATFSENTRAVTFINGSTQVGHWGTVVGAGASARMQPGDLKLSDDAYVWYRAE